MAYGMKYTKGGFPFKTDLTKKSGLGPRAEKKKVKDDNVPLNPGFEDPIKIQKVQREGITPNSQKFSKKAVKSTTTAHGDLRNAEEEYRQDVELLKNQ